MLCSPRSHEDLVGRVLADRSVECTGMKTTKKVILIVIWAGACAWANGVELRKGDVWYIDERRAESRLTECGCVTSMDYANGLATIVRRRAARNPAPSVQVVQVRDGRVLHELTLPVEFEPGQRSDKIAKAVFDEKRQVMYLLVAAWATKHSLVRYDVVTQRIVPIGYAIDVELVRTGQYRGDLVALVRKVKLSPGIWNAYWLLDPDGKEKGYIGNEHEKDEFLAFLGYE